MDIHVDERFQLAPSVIAALRATTGDSLNPAPTRATYTRTFIRLPDDGVIGLIQAQWPIGLTGTGLNLVFIANEKVAAQAIAAYNELKYDDTLTQYMPILRFYSASQDMRVLLFTWPKSHPDGASAFSAKRLNDSFDSEVMNLSEIVNAIHATLLMLDDWNSNMSSRITFQSAASVFDPFPAITNPPVPANVANVAFDLKGVPPLPNPLWLLNDPGPIKHVILPVQVGIVNGSLTCDRLLIGSKPMPLDWSIARRDTIVWLDYARFEIDLLLRLLPPSDSDIWAFEWPHLVLGLRELILQPEHVSGRLTPSALATVAPIRRAVQSRIQGNSGAFWLSAVHAGLEVIADPKQNGANRLAATLYAAVALDRAQAKLNFSWPDSNPSVVAWPGFLAWRSLPTRKVPLGYALLVGAGVFTNDGKIDQLPQVKYDLEELAAFLDGRGYEVHMLRDGGFTRQALESQLDALRNDVQFSNAPFIVCFCGHGIPYQGKYYLLTGDSTSTTIGNKSIDVQMLFSRVAQMNSSRTLMLINSCYSGQTLSVPFKPSNIGGGQFALLTSASIGEKSYMLRDDPLSLFIGAVLEGLSTANRRSGPVHLFDFLKYVTYHVPVRARKVGMSQNPCFVLNEITEDFVLI